MALSLLFFLSVGADSKISYEAEQLAYIFLKYLILLFAFIIFEVKIKFFQIQTGHSYVTLFFVLLSCFLIEDLIFSQELYAFTILSVAIIRLLNLSIGWNVKTSIFESVFLIGIASFFYKPAIVFLGLVLIATVVFTKSKWRYYVIPFLAIGCIITFTQVYFLYHYKAPAGFQVFLPSLRNDFSFFADDISVYMAVFYLISSFVFLYQIYSVKQIRSLYHRQMATFFLAFFGLALMTLIFEDSSVSDLWLMSLWPFCIYLGDFVSRIKKNLWLQVAFWGFTLISISLYFLSVFE
jgi:hypothetical protein